MGGGEVDFRYIKDTIDVELVFEKIPIISKIVRVILTLIMQETLTSTGL